MIKQSIEYVDIGNFSRVIKIDRSYGFPEVSWYWDSREALRCTIEELKNDCTEIRIRPQDLVVGPDFRLRNGLCINNLVVQKMLYWVSGPGLSVKTKVLRNPRINYRIFNSIVNGCTDVHLIVYTYSRRLGMIIDAWRGPVPSILPMERLLQYLELVHLKGIAEVLWAGWYADEAYTCVYAEDCSWLGIAWVAPPKFAMRRHMGYAKLDDVDQIASVPFMCGPLFPVFEGAKMSLLSYPAKFELVLNRLIRTRKKYKDKPAKFRFAKWKT